MALSRKLTAKIYEIKAHNGNVTGVDLGETGRVLVTGGQDRNVNLWAIGEEKCFMSLTGHNRPIDCVRFAYNDDFVYSADDIGIIRRWDLNAQTIYSTLNGHMKSVRTLDFNPSGEYVVSGSNDTTVRLWDVRNQNKCIKVYRGHMTHVNSVKFSPDGLWIASAGTEGSVIIWDIRKSKQIMEFTEQPPAVAITCIQFHPFEFLLAAGRIDGTVCIYDLESRLCISKTNATSQFYGHPIRCITFSENGECLFVGTSLGISVIGWEPDREFDNIKPIWNSLGDMKIVNRKLICCSYDKDYVTINALSINRVFPFYNPSNVSAPAFSHNSTTRKSFSRGNQKLRLSIVHVPKPSRLIEENEDSQSPSLDGQSSPNLSLEIVDDTANDFSGSPTLNGGCGTNGSVSSNVHFDTNNEMTLSMPKKTTSSPPFHYSSIASSSGYSSFGGNGFAASNFEGPSSLKMPGERDIYHYENVAGVVCNDVEYNLNDSNPPIIANYDQTEMLEDFPVNQNLHQQHTSATSVTSTIASAASVTSSTSGHAASAAAAASARSAKSKVSNVQKRFATGNNTHTRGKLSQVSSVSTTELNKIDDNMLLKKSASSYIVNKGGKRPVNSQLQANKENARNKNITVQFITKPPMRSKTSLDLRTSHQHQQIAAATAAAAQRQTNRVSSYTADATSTTNIPISYRPDANLITQSRFANKNLNNRGVDIDDSSELQMLSASHVHILQALSNRNATLHLIRNLTRSHDIVGALRQSIKMSERSIFVDLLGAILEKTSLWNLDLCLLLLPEIYELLQSQHKFHYIRACDTLRVILSNFLPIIQENLDPWAACGLGVDVSREERQRKCIECQHWLLKIRNLPASSHLGTSLTQLQNMIVNI